MPLRDAHPWAGSASFNVRDLGVHPSTVQPLRLVGPMLSSSLDVVLSIRWPSLEADLVERTILEWRDASRRGLEEERGRLEWGVECAGYGRCYEQVEDTEYCLERVASDVL